jgi:hypothetical protein
LPNSAYLSFATFVLDSRSIIAILARYYTDVSEKFVPLHRRHLLNAAISLPDLASVADRCTLPPQVRDREERRILRALAREGPCTSLRPLKSHSRRQAENAVSPDAHRASESSAIASVLDASSGAGSKLPQSGPADILLDKKNRPRETRPAFVSANPPELFLTGPFCRGHFG